MKYGGPAFASEATARPAEDRPVKDKVFSVFRYFSRNKGGGIADLRFEII
jgi:hypothetical protein